MDSINVLLIRGFKRSDFGCVSFYIDTNNWAFPQLHIAFGVDLYRSAIIAPTNLGKFSCRAFWIIPFVSGSNDSAAIYWNSLGYLSLRDNDSALSLSGLAKLADFLVSGAGFVLLQRSEEYSLPTHSIWPKDAKKLPGTTLPQDLSQLALSQSIWLLL